MGKILPKPSSADTWFRTAREKILDAEKLQAEGIFHLAYMEAVYSGENALKAILAKFGKIAPGDFHHDQKKLVAKIKMEELLPYETVERIQEITRDLDFVDVSSDSGDHIYCTSHQVGNLRYSAGESTPSELISKRDSDKKIRLAKDLLKILEPFINK